MTESNLPTSSLIADPCYRRLKEHLIAATGLAYYSERDDDLCIYAGRRLAELNLPDCASCMGLLRDGETGTNELDKLIEQLTIGETFFFRHREMFDALRDTVLPDVIRRNQASRRLRIWSAGCSFGAEPYSISILLRRELAHLIPGWDVSILATDINRDFLSRARLGSFEEWAFRGVPEDLRRECFSQEGKTWSINPTFREGITFQYHNLVEHPFPSMLQNLFAFDVILCRNVMIYFSKEITQRVVAHFHDALVRGGWLLVGHAEPNVETFRAYRMVNAAGAVTYQKTEEPAPPRSMIGRQCSPALASRSLLPAAEIAWAEPATDQARRSRQPHRAAWPVSPKATSVHLDGATPKAPHLGELANIRLLADAGDLELALNCCEELLAADKLDPAVHLYHALILEQLGRHQETELALRRAIYLDRAYVLAHYYLGLTAQKQNQSQVAIRSFRNVLEILAQRKPDQRIPDGEDLRGVELEKLTRMHLAALDECKSRNPSEGIPMIDWESTKQHLRDSELMMNRASAGGPERLSAVFRERAVRLAARRPASAAAVTRPILVFGLNTERYGIELTNVLHVMPFLNCTPVPGAPPSLLGVINLRGEIRSVMSLARLLDLPGPERSEGSIVLVCNKEHVIGFKVDSLEKIERIAIESLRRVSHDGGRGYTSASCIQGTTPDAVNVLDVPQLFSHPLFTHESKTRKQETT